MKTKRSLLVLAFIALIVLAISSCTPQRNGCNATRGMSGFK